MGTTYVEIDNNGFWMKDGILELWLRLVSLHIRDENDDIAPAHVIRNQFLLASRGYFVGCVPHGIEQAVSSNEGKLAVLDAIESLRQTLSHAPKKLDKGVLNVIGIEGQFITDFETSRLVDVCNAIEDLIKGKIKNTDVSDTSFMPGSKNVT